jgi:hypothetical protein
MAKNGMVIRFPTRRRSLPRSSGGEQFTQATLDAEAFFAACRAHWGRRTLTALSKKLSPLAVEIVIQLQAEWNARRGPISGK